jgi:uncharacterized protein involved in type VI secretion and phage assembly
VIDLDLFEGLAGRKATDQIYGVVIGIVTNVEDPDGLGRVKLRFPWLSADHESHWARLAAPMAGGDRGFYALPRPDDEVLVAFEQGSVERPSVLGALWNGKDKPPAGGGPDVRILKSKSGHVVRLDDTDGAEKIEIVDGKGTESLVFDTAARTITLTADMNVVIESKSGMVQIIGQKGVEITAPGGKGTLETQGELNVSSTGGNVNVKGNLINLN